MPGRLPTAIAASAIAGTLAFLAGPATAQAPPPELLPDLQGLPAEDLRIQAGSGGRNLRLTSSVGNAGDGAFEVFPEPGNGGDCDGDGGVNDDRFAFQRVFRDVDLSGSFERNADTDSVTYPVGCMVFHPTHDHWHFEDFASFDLLIPGTDQVVASTAKVGFCLLDFWPYRPGLGGHPVDEHYGLCSPDEEMGISVGWADTYDSTLAGQRIDVSNMPDGDYCLTVTGDPSGIVRESNELNNEARTLISVVGDSVTSIGGNCAARSAAGENSTLRSRAVKGAKCKRAKGAKKKRRCRRPLT